MKDNFKPNLAVEVPNEDIIFPKLGSPKLDGIRCVTSQAGVYSRSLKLIPNHSIRRRLGPFSGLDGEIIVGSPTDEDVYRTTASGVMSADSTPEFTYYVFDHLDTLGPYTDRYGVLQGLQGLPDFIKVLPQTLIETKEQLEAYYNNLLEQGYEGAILRNLNAPYKFGRSTAKSQDMVKLKPFLDSEGIVESVYEAMHNTNEAFTNELGQTDRSTSMAGLVGKGMIGGFVLRDVKSGQLIQCGAGKSTHAQRVEWFANPPIGRMCVYRHMPYGLMANGQPRFARFHGWRDSIDM